MRELIQNHLGAFLLSCYVFWLVVGCLIMPWIDRKLTLWVLTTKDEE